MYTPVRYEVRSRRVIALAIALMLAFALIPPASASASTSGELLPNPSFTQGPTGWKTNNSQHTLTVLNAGIAELTSSKSGHVVLNDEPNVVASATKGSKYVVTARVRTTTPNVSGAVRIREVAGAQVSSSSTTFRLSDRSWQNIKLEVNTIYGDSKLDLNVLAYSLEGGKNLQIDSVSVTQATTVTTPPVSIPPDQPTSKCDAAPPSGTVFGASLSTSTQTFTQSLNSIDSSFGKVGVVRHFSSGLPMSWSGKNAQLLEDRTIVTSFKAPPTEITSGKHDAFFANWFASAPSDQTIYWSYYHEPENNINKGEFTAAQYRAAWAHLATIERQACKPNMHATLILTEWTMQPSSKRDYRTYDAGPEYVKVLAFDPYNGVSDPDRSYYESPQDLLGPIVSKMNADGRPWGLAELGSRLIPGDVNGAQRAVWLQSIADYSIKNNALFVSYFQSYGKGTDYLLLDTKSVGVWSNLVGR